MGYTRWGGYILESLYMKQTTPQHIILYSKLQEYPPLNTENVNFIAYSGFIFGEYKFSK